MMPDREKVINAYECVITREKSVCECGKCDYHIKDSAVFFCDNQRVLTDVLSLLKEQEAVEPKVSCTEQRCGNCNKVIEMDGWQSCPWCGKRIDWKGWWKKNGTRNQDS